MVKKEKKSNVSGKPKHSLDANRSHEKKKTTGGRTAATVRRLHMYNTRPRRTRDGEITSNVCPSGTWLQPDRRWFVNTRVVDQKQLEYFREELHTKMFMDYNVILKERKLLMSLLTDTKKQAKVHLVDNDDGKVEDSNDTLR